VEAGEADLAGVVLPRFTVFHFAGAVDQVIFAAAILAVKSANIGTALHFAEIALELEVGEAVSALPSLVSHAALVHGLADALRSEVVPAVAGRASVFVVGLAVDDFADAVGQLEGAVALLADLADLSPAAEDGVVHAKVADETVPVGAVSAGGLAVVGVAHAVPDGGTTGAILDVVVRGAVEANPPRVLLQTADEVGLLALAADQVESLLAGKAAIVGRPLLTAVLSAVLVQFAEAVLLQDVAVVAGQASSFGEVLVASFHVVGRNADFVGAWH
jgi:hypothetical protein